MELQSEVVVGPDFVESEDDGEEEDEDEELVKAEEAEIARLARERTFGLGVLVDRLLSWTLFEIGDGEEKGGEDGQARSRPVRRRDETRFAMRTDLVAGSAETEQKSQQREDEEQGGWKDVAWLLSVASKVIL